MKEYCESCFSDLCEDEECGSCPICGMVEVCDTCGNRCDECWELYCDDCIINVKDKNGVQHKYCTDCSEKLNI